MAKRKSKGKSKGQKKAVKKRKQSVSLKDQIYTHLNNSDWESAEPLLRKWSEEKNDSHTHYLLGYVIRRLSNSKNDRYAEAINCQQTAINLMLDENENGWPYYEMGIVYSDYWYDSHDKDKAIEYFKKATECLNAPYDAFIRLSGEYNFNDIDTKIAILKQGIERFPEIRDGYLICAIWLSINKKEYDQAESILLDAIENGIHSTAVYNALGDLKVKQKFYNKAIEYFKQILSLKCDPIGYAVTNFKIATSYLGLKELNLAKEYFLKSLDQSDDISIESANYFGLINCYFLMGKKDKAIHFLNKFDFSQQKYDKDSFCGFPLTPFGYEDYHLDYGTENYDFSELILGAVNFFEDEKDFFVGKQKHTYYLIKAIIYVESKKYDDCLNSLEIAYAEHDSNFLHKVFKKLFDDMLFDEDGDYIEGKSLTKYVKSYINTCKRIPSLASLLAQSVREGLVSALFEEKRYEKIIKICELTDNEDFRGIQFEAAYAYNEKNNSELAKKLYSDYLNENPKSNAALNNLANIYDREGEYDTAIELYNKAVEVDPEDKIANKNLQITLDRKRKLEAKKAEQQKIENHQIQIQKAAKVHWPSLDWYKKKVLMVLNEIDGFDGFENLAKLCNIEERWARIHYNKLVQIGMIIETDDSFNINPDIVPYLERENSHSVAINIVRSDESINFKPIFNSKLEYEIYRIMIGLFPNHLVFPNMSLQSIFSYDRLNGILEPDVFKYYLMASVDICVVSTANYLPIIGYEIDSPYHDQEVQIARDEKKNEIFKMGGVPFVRIRPYGRPSEGEIRSRIIKATQEFGAALDPSEKRFEMFFSLLKNFDKMPFE